MPITISPDANTPSLVVNSQQVYLPTSSGSLALTSSLGVRNKIMNGKMEIFQRGSGGTATDGTYVLDRWAVMKSGTMVATVGQGTLTPSNEFQSNFFATITTTDTSMTTTDIFGFYQRIEGYNIRDLIGRTFTLSFWVYVVKPGIYSVSFSNTVDRSYIAEYTVNASNTWEYKTITVTGGLPTAGTWNYTNSTGLQVSFLFAAGPTWQVAAGSWQVGNFRAGLNQTNGVDTLGSVVLTGVQLEVGTSATPFEQRPIPMEVLLCQRYFQSMALTTNFNGSNGQAITATKYATTDVLTANVPLATSMRTTPTVSVSQTTCRAVLSSAVNTFTLSTASCPSSMGPVCLAYTQNATAAGYGWIDAIGTISVNAEL
jgi:hypothetical protein